MELMISLTIGLVLLAGVTTLIVKQSSTRDELDKSSRQIENGRYAIQLLRDDIEHAGFYGEYSPPATTVYNEAVDPCVADNTGWVPATPEVPVGIFGYAGAAADPSCVTNRKAGTAILVIRRTASDEPIASATAGTTYLQVSRCDQDPLVSPFVMATSDFSLRKKDCLTPALLRKYIVRIYYVSTCNVCGTGGDTVPTLKVREFVNGAVTTLPLAEGIEDMQFDYGVDTTGDGAPDSYHIPPLAGQWRNVMAVRVNVLARNNDPTVGYVDAKSYRLSGISTVAAVGPFNAAPYTLSPACGGTASYPQLCNYKRHAFNQLVRVINPSGRRER